jgi:hypothetical protein
MANFGNTNNNIKTLTMNHFTNTINTIAQKIYWYAFMGMAEKQIKANTNLNKIISLKYFFHYCVGNLRPGDNIIKEILS